MTMRANFLCFEILSLCKEYLSGC